MKTDNYPSLVGAFLLFLALIAISCLDDKAVPGLSDYNQETQVEFRDEWLRIFGYFDFNACTAVLDVYVDESGQLVHELPGTMDFCDGFPGDDELPFGFSAESWNETGIFRLTSPFLIRDSFLDLWFPGCFPVETYTGIEALQVFYENGRWVMEVELEPAYQQCLAGNKNAFYIRFDVKQRQMPVAHETVEVQDDLN